MARTLQPWLSLLLLACLAPFAGAAQLQADPELGRALTAAQENRAEILRALNEAPLQGREDMRWLVVHMPDQDLRSTQADFLLANYKLALAAREANSWAQAVPHEIWRNDVLPYAQVNEAREEWRADFLTRFLPRVSKAKTTSEAAMILNLSIFAELGVKYSTKRNKPDQAPSESIEIGLASCTGLSILLADACRAVGIPARLAGTANWFDKRGNHTWVEIWDQDGWHFVGAAEPDPKGLDRGWFAGDAAKATPGSREHGIWAVSWQATPQSVPMVWAPEVDWVHAVDVTQRYLPKVATGSSDTAPQKAPGVQILLAVHNAAGERIEAHAKLRDPVTRQVVFEGRTRDESRDANDFLEIPASPDSRWKLEIAIGERNWIYNIFIEGEARNPVVLKPMDNDGLLLGGEVRAKAMAWFEASAEDRRKIDFSAANEWLAGMAANPRLAEEARKMIWDAYRDADIHAETRADVAANRVRHGGHESPYTIKTVGERPRGGWPLFIAMHGGGGTTQEFNDSQWRHMQIYYKDQLDLAGGYKYIALRAPNNTWNGFYDNYVYPLIEKLINQHLLFSDVNPNKVYAMGYSHGGYGAFSIGPKIPDRFAAVHASAAAPSDGETVATGLHTLRFSYMIGSEDTAYGRADRCQAFAEKVAALKQAHPDAYPVEMMWIEGNGHGGLPDRDMIRQLYPYTRRTSPSVLRWELTDPVVTRHYWLRAENPSKKQRIDAELRGNRIQLEMQGRDNVEFLMTGEQIDASVPLQVQWGEQHYEFTPNPSIATLCETLLERGDPKLMASMRFRVKK